MKLIGILLIALGLVGLLYGGISWIERDKVVDLGPVEVVSEDRESIPFPPIAGAICLIAGTALLVAGSRSRSAA
jgi:hypothetical protein